MALDSNLLLGKLSYACGRYDDALKYYNNAELDSLTEKELPCRGLKIVAESYAVNGNFLKIFCGLIFLLGLCLEKIPPDTTSKFKQAEREERVSKCFELATDLTLLYLQKLEEKPQDGSSIGSHSSMMNMSRQIGPILETALQRAPIVHIHAGNLVQAANRYRSMLTAVETSATQRLRLILTKQLAEVLLRGLRGELYVPPSAVSPSIKGKFKKKKHCITLEISLQGKINPSGSRKPTQASTCSSRPPIKKKSFYS